MNKKNVFILIGLIFALLLTACGGATEANANTNTNSGETAELFDNYVPVASATKFATVRGVSCSCRATSMLPRDVTKRAIS